MANNIKILNAKILSLFNSGASLDTIRSNLNQYHTPIVDKRIKALGLQMAEDARKAKAEEARKAKAEETRKKAEDDKKTKAEEARKKAEDARKAKAEETEAKFAQEKAEAEEQARKLKAEAESRKNDEARKANAEEARKANAEETKKDEKNIVKLFSLLNKDLLGTKNFLSQHSELRDKVANPCFEKKKLKMCIKDYDMDRIFPQENLDNNNLKQKPLYNLDLSTCSDNSQLKIPKKLHYVWFSSNGYTDETDQENKFKDHNKYLYENLYKTKGWDHYLWTNDEKLIPQSAKIELAAKGVKILSIDSLNTPDATTKVKSLIQASKQFAEEKLFGLSTDIARYLIMQKEGGIYIDGDYKLHSVKRPLRNVDLVIFN